jgi:hypothetical protein
MLRPSVYVTGVACLVSLSLSAEAFDGLALAPKDAIAQQCYGAAMVGMDSVINSRLGVPPEKVVDLARLTQVGSLGAEGFSYDLLKDMLYAYMWEGSPHSYAVTVFFECAQRNAPLRSAQTDVD